MQAEVAGVRRELIVRERLMRVFLAILGDVTAALGAEKARQTGGEITTASSSSSVVQGKKREQPSDHSGDSSDHSNDNI